MDFSRRFDEELDPDKALKVLHRICHQAVATPSLVYSVLYYADREHLANNSRTIYGETYLAYHHAAVPSFANHVYMTLNLPTRDTPLYLQVRRLFVINDEGWMINRDMSERGETGLSEHERQCIDSALYWYRSASPREVIISRRDSSWQNTPNGKSIAFDEMLRHGAPIIVAQDADIPDPKAMSKWDGNGYLSLPTMMNPA